jgi:hypothetical protein
MFGFKAGWNFELNSLNNAPLVKTIAAQPTRNFPAFNDTLISINAFPMTHYLTVSRAR